MTEKRRFRGVVGHRQGCKPLKNDSCWAPCSPSGPGALGARVVQGRFGVPQQYGILGLADVELEVLLQETVAVVRHAPPRARSSPACPVLRSTAS